MITGRKLLRIIVKRFWGACAFLLISLAVIVVVGRALSPELDRYKDELAVFLGEQLTAQVSIDNMRVDWSGLTPELSLEGVQLTNADGQVVMTMGNALLKLNLLRSLVSRNLALDALVAADVELDVAQSDEGEWRFRGLPWSATSDGDINIDDPLDIALLIGQVDLKDVQLNLHYHDGGENLLNFPTLVFANSGEFHRLSSSIVVESQREAVSLIVEFRGDPRNLNDFSAKGYTRCKRVDVEKVVAALPAQFQSEDPVWKNRVVTIESWFDIFAGGEVLFRGRVDVDKDDTSVVNEEFSGVKIPSLMGANFTGRLTSRGFWSVSVRDAVVDWEDFQAPIVDFELSSQNSIPEDGESLPDSSTERLAPIVFRASDLELTQWIDTLNQAGLIPQQAFTALKDLKPRGRFENIKFSLNPSIDKPLSFELQANFDQFNIDSWRGTPIVSGIRGFAILSGPLDQQFSGEIHIDSRDQVSLRFPTLYDSPMEFSGLIGQVNWQVDAVESKIHIHSGLLSAPSNEGNARGFFDLNIPLKKEPGHEQLILQLGIQQSEVKFYQKYVPSRLPKNLLEWLEASVDESGSVERGGFLYRGGLTPEGRRNATFQLYADIRDANLNYHNDWPALTHASGYLWMNELDVSAEVYRGKFLDSTIKKLEFTVTGDTNSGERELSVEGSAHGDASDGLSLLRSEVFLPIIDHKLDDWVVQGPVTTNAQLSIPLAGNESKPRQNITVSMSGVDLEIDNLSVDVSDIQGNINFSDRESLQALNLTGQFLQQPIEADIVDDRQTKLLHIAVRGQNSIEKINEWAGLEVLDFANGDAQFNVDITIPNQSAKKNSELKIHSLLAGVEIDLPAPWGKKSDVEKQITLSAPIGQQNTYFRMNYDDELFGVFHTGRNGLRRAVLSTDPDSKLPEKYQLKFEGALAQFDFDDWRDTYDQYFLPLSDSDSPSYRPLPIALALQVDRFIFGDFKIDMLDLEGDIVNGEAKIVVQSERITGDINVSSDEGKPIVLDLKHLRLPKKEQRNVTWEDIFFPPSRPSDALEKLDPSTVPALDFKVEELYVGEGLFGAWSFLSRPVPGGLVINNLTANFEEGQILSLQPDEVGARLNWLNTEAGVETRIEGRFLSSDLARVIEKLDQPQLLQADTSSFDFSLAWPGAPTQMSTATLSGEIGVLMEQGSFYRSGDQSPGGALLQLVSIFNFDTWVRRLRLDFSDLGRAGLAFDQVEGLLHFEQGQVLLEKPIVVETQSGEFQLTGIVDLANNQLDTKMVATLPMGGNLTFLTALAAGLPAAVGVWVVSKIFDEQIDKVSTLSYSIDGPLQNPHVEFDQLFDNKNKPTATSEN